MNIKTFNFPSFEEWKVGQDFRQSIGEYKCCIHGYAYMAQFTNERIYEASIKYYDYDGLEVLFESSMSCFPDEYDHLSKWYEKVTVELNSKWKEYILKTYFDEAKDKLILEHIKKLYCEYRYFCNECPKMYDFSCSGANASKCQIKKDKILAEIKKLKSQLK
ncbi:MAG: hypothetical protein IJ223_04945 [Clostridia bacterium]|nr:hypothetical protein [Clostridia bacterium]